MNGPATTGAPRTWPMFRALVGIGLLCGFLIVGAYELTAPIIEKNRAEALHRAIFEALPGARSVEYEWTGQAFSPADGAPAGRRVFASYDDSDELVGVAVEAEGMGYQDTIKVLYGYSLKDRAIVGMVVLESRETPGLGDKIGSDPEFRANFDRLDATHPIEVVAHGEKTSPWQIDAITGATISSTAVADLLRDSVAAWAERIDSRAGDFSKH